MDLRTTDYLLFVGMAYFVIKQLLNIINKRSDSPPEIVRVHDESEIIFRQNMMQQHTGMTEALKALSDANKQTVDKLQEISVILVGIDRVGQSTNNKVENIKNDMILVKDRVDNLVQNS